MTPSGCGFNWSAQPLDSDLRAEDVAYEAADEDLLQRDR